MKKAINVAKTLTVFFVIALGFRGMSQDTLHINYVQISTKLADTSEAKIAKWAASLAGKHMDVRVLAYYSQPDFRKYAQERADEMFLELNRKARSLITIVSYGPQKGAKSQRSRVDIVYTPTGALTPDEMAKAKAKEEKAAADAAKEAAKASEKQAADAKKKEGDKKETVAKKEEKSDKKSDDKKSDKDKDKGDKKEKDGKDGDDEEDKSLAYSTVVTINDGNTLTLEEVNYIKAAKFVVAQTGDKGMDDNLLKAVKECWNFTSASDVMSMPYKEARAAGKENKKQNMVILSIGQVKTWFTQKSFGVSYKILKIGRCICLENASGKTLYKQIIPTEKGVGVTNEYMVFGISYMNSLFKTMADHNIEKSSKVTFMNEADALEMKERPLVIKESMINPKLPKEDISKYYTGKVQLVSDQEWKDAIVEKKDVDYVMIVKLPSTSQSYWHYILNAKTGKVYVFDNGPGFQMGINVGVNKNLDPSQSGFVDKANFERYEQATVDAKANELKQKGKEEAAKKKEADKKDAAEAKAKADKEKAEKKQKEKEEAAQKKEAEKKAEAEKKQKEKEEKEKK